MKVRRREEQLGLTQRRRIAEKKNNESCEGAKLAKGGAMLAGLKVMTFVLAIIAAAAGAEDFSEPRLPPEEILKRVSEYLANEKPSIQMEKYELTSLSFNYRNGRWSVMYECLKPTPPGCFFNIWVSNSIDPEFRYFAGE